MTARGSPKGGKNIIILFDMNGGILVGGFINCICTFHEEKKRKTSKTSGENPRRFCNSVVKKKSAKVSYCYMYNLNYPDV